MTFVVIREIFGTDILPVDALQVDALSGAVQPHIILPVDVLPVDVLAEDVLPVAALPVTVAGCFVQPQIARSFDTLLTCKKFRMRNNGQRQKERRTP